MSYEAEFEKIWSSKPSKEWMAAAPSRFQEELKRSKGMNTAGDWLSLVPIALIVVYQGSISVGNELLRYLIVAVLIIVWFVIWEMIKPYITNKRSEADILNDVKAYFYQQWMSGKL